MTLKDLVASFIGLINYTIPVLTGAALVIFFWGLIKLIYRAGDAKGAANDRKFIAWGLLALFVLASLWGIIATLCLSFFGDSKCDPVDSRSLQNVPGGSLNDRPFNL